MSWTAAPLLLALACSGGDTTAAADSGTTAPADSGTTAATDSGPGDTSTPTGETGDTEPPAACPSVTSVDVVGGADQLLELGLTAELDLAGTAWVVCTADDDPTEQHLGESVESGQTHGFRVFGLAPERAYTCTVRSDCVDGAEGTASWTTPALPEDVSSFTVTEGAHERWGSYTLFPEIEPCEDYDTTNLHALVVDPVGTVRWLYEIPDPIVSSDVDVRYLGDGWIHIVGGWGTFDTRAPHRGMFRTVDLGNQVIHHRDAPDLGEGFNHHSERLETGEFVTHTYALHGSGLNYAVGMTVEVWDPETETITWSWDSEETWETGGGVQTQGAEIWASNSLTWTDDALGPALYVNVVTVDSIWRIDRDTKQVTHIIGHGQGWQLQDAAGQPMEKHDWFYFQHDPEFTAEGSVLLHDNGQGRPGDADYSRVVEFDIDWDNQILTEVWSWTEADWYNPYLGDADRLANDNVLVATGHVWCASGRDDASSVMEIEPTTGELAWRMDWDNPDYAVYRAERLDGCEIFQNAATCPEVADRIAALGSGAAVPGD